MSSILFEKRPFHTLPAGGGERRKKSGEPHLLLRFPAFIPSVTGGKRRKMSLVLSR